MKICLLTNKLSKNKLNMLLKIIIYFNIIFIKILFQIPFVGVLNGLSVLFSKYYKVSHNHITDLFCSFLDFLHQQTQQTEIIL